MRRKTSEPNISIVTSNACGVLKVKRVEELLKKSKKHKVGRYLSIKIITYDVVAGGRSVLGQAE